MWQADLRKCVSLIMVLLLVTLSVTGFCRNAFSSELPSDSTFSSSITKGAGNTAILAFGACCPVDPEHDHSLPDHCDSSCNCACHAPLMVHPVQLVCRSLVTPLVFHETTSYPPEVYLSKFIPPENLS